MIRTPWSRGFFVGEGSYSSEEAIKKAGLDWKIDDQKLFRSSDGVNVFPIESHKAIVRLYDQVQLGIVGKDYKLVQNTDAFRLLDSLVEDNKMKYVAAGQIKYGSGVWLLGDIGKTEIIKGDEVSKYIMLYNTHDGTSKLKIFFTTVRIACGNMIRLALNKQFGAMLGKKHSKHLDIDLVRLEAQEVLGLANERFNEYETRAKQLARTTISDNQWEELMTRLIPDPPEDSISQRILTRRQNIRDKMTELFVNGQGQDINGVANTGWAAYNAVVEYNNYYTNTRGENRQEKRFISSMFGSGSTMIQEAEKQLLHIGV